MENRRIETGEDNPILRRKAKEIKEITPQIKELVLGMIKTMKSAKDSIGLAAPQVGESLRIIIVGDIKNKGKVLVLINPEIKKSSFRKETLPEGCLSLPGFQSSVKRSKKISLRGLSLDGELIEIKTEGFLARIIQHEIDHLDGVLISDKNG
ncbi:MAG: peptide deformylase [Candidatus Portnoybacteria bacterium]